MELDLRITKATNGFILRYDDPEIRKKNRESDGWQDPEVNIVFTDVAALSKALEPMLQFMAEQDENESKETSFSTAFKEAIGD